MHGDDDLSVDQLSQSGHNRLYPYEQWHKQWRSAVTTNLSVATWPLGHFTTIFQRRKFQLLVQLSSCLSSRVSSSFHFPFISCIASSGPSQRTVNFWHCQYGFLYYTCLQITGCHVVHALLHVLFHRLLLYRSAAMWLCYYNSKKCYNDRKLSQFNKICS